MRFLNYVMYDTMSLVGQNTVPSTPGQRVLAEALTEEIRSFGIEDVRLDEKGTYMEAFRPTSMRRYRLSDLSPIWILPMPIRLEAAAENHRKL